MGNRIKPTVIRNIKSRREEVLFSSIPEITQPISPGTAHIITSLMESVVKMVPILFSLSSLAASSISSSSFFAASLFLFSAVLSVIQWEETQSDSALSLIIQTY